MMKFQRAGYVVVALVLLNAGCEQVQRADDITAPAYANNENPTPLARRVGHEGIPRVCVDVSGERKHKLSAGGHTLEIPKGAISGEAEFCMEVVAGETIEVELTATRADGEELHTFLTPLELTLSYEDAVDADGLTGLSISYVVDGEVIETIWSVRDHGKRTVTGSLSHFSRWCITAD